MTNALAPFRHPAYAVMWSATLHALRAGDALKAGPGELTRAGGEDGVALVFDLPAT
jgi:hypothetical protein